MEILFLDNSKACHESDIPTKVIKGNSDSFSDILYGIFNRRVYLIFYINVPRGRHISI